MLIRKSEKAVTSVDCSASYCSQSWLYEDSLYDISLIRIIILKLILAGALWVRPLIKNLPNKFSALESLKPRETKAKERWKPHLFSLFFTQYLISFFILAIFQLVYCLSSAIIFRSRKKNCWVVTYFSHFQPFAIAAPITITILHVKARSAICANTAATQ